MKPNSLLLIVFCNLLIISVLLVDWWVNLPPVGVYIVDYQGGAEYAICHAERSEASLLPVPMRQRVEKELNK